MDTGVMVIDPSVEARQHLDRAYGLLNRDEYEAALRACQAAFELAPDSADVHNLRGVVLDDSGRTEEAIAAYRMAVRCDPTVSEAWENLREAESAVEASAGRRVPGDVDSVARARVHLDQAAALLERKEYGSVLQECDAALGLMPDCGRAHSLRGAVLLELGRLEKAVAAFCLAVRRDPTLTEAWAGLLRAESALERRQGAQSESGPVASPEVVQEYLDSAHGCLDRVDYRGALQACQAALSLAPDCAEAHNLRGLVLDDLGHPREAAGAYRLAVHYDPELQEAQKNLLEVEPEVVAVPPPPSPAPSEGKRFGIRAASYLIDWVMHYISSWVAGFLAGVAVVMLLLLFNKPGAVSYLGQGLEPGWPFTIAGVMLSVVYFALFEWLYGATPGKLVLGMRVVGQDGGRCSAKAALVRGLLRYWDAFFFCVPALVTMEAPLQQRVGDKAARTMVVGSKDPGIRERREWGWFLVAAGILLVVDFTAYSLAVLGTLTAAGQL
jgi:tetratricopeptide (TPR) repeat protein